MIPALVTTKLEAQSQKTEAIDLTDFDREVLATALDVLLKRTCEYASDYYVRARELLKILEGV